MISINPAGGVDLFDAISEYTAHGTEYAPKKRKRTLIKYDISR